MRRLQFESFLLWWGRYAREDVRVVGSNLCKSKLFKRYFHSRFPHPRIPTTPELWRSVGQQCLRTFYSDNKMNRADKVSVYLTSQQGTRAVNAAQHHNSVYVYDCYVTMGQPSELCKFRIIILKKCQAFHKHKLCTSRIYWFPWNHPIAYSIPALTLLFCRWFKWILF